MREFAVIEDKCVTTTERRDWEEFPPNSWFERTRGETRTRQREREQAALADAEDEFDGNSGSSGEDPPRAGV